jgi:hypothetical protein
LNANTKTSVANNVNNEETTKADLETEIIRSINKNILLNDVLSNVKYPSVHARNSVNISQYIDPNQSSNKQKNNVSTTNTLTQQVKSLDYNITSENYKDIKTYAESKRCFYRFCY